MALASCGDEESKLPSNTKAFLENYAALVDANYTDSQARATALSDALHVFVADPTEEKLSAARAAWIEARVAYLQTEAFRFQEGPIDEIDDFVNAWPVNEAHIDYVAGMPDSGYVNDTSVAITPASLEAQNLPEGGGEADVAVGWHAIEFLLWGQDESAIGPGNRAPSDYGDATPITTRRGEALTTLGTLLVGHLEDLATTWAPGGEYRATFAGQSDKAALTQIVSGLSIFSGNELGGERLAAINSNSQEDEHSCFSDTTHQDFVGDAIGIQNVYLGRYTTDSGTAITGVGLYDVVAAVNPTLADSLRDRIATSISLAMAVHDPYDQEILATNPDGLARLTALQTSLQQQKVLFDQVASTLGLPPAPVDP